MLVPPRQCGAFLVVPGQLCLRARILREAAMSCARLRLRAGRSLRPARALWQRVQPRGALGRVVEGQRQRYRGHVPQVGPRLVRSRPAQCAHRHVASRFLARAMRSGGSALRCTHACFHPPSFSGWSAGGAMATTVSSGSRTSRLSGPSNRYPVSNP